VIEPGLPACKAGDLLLDLTLPSVGSSPSGSTLARRGSFLPPLRVCVRVDPLLQQLLPGRLLGVQGITETSSQVLQGHMYVGRQSQVWVRVVQHQLHNQCRRR
jgi:hypothetical protein